MRRRRIFDKHNFMDTVKDYGFVIYPRICLLGLKNTSVMTADISKISTCVAYPSRSRTSPLDMRAGYAKPTLVTDYHV